MTPQDWAKEKAREIADQFKLHQHTAESLILEWGSEKPIVVMNDTFIALRDKITAALLEAASQSPSGKVEMPCPACGSGPFVDVTMFSNNKVREATDELVYQCQTLVSASIILQPRRREALEKALSDYKEALAALDETEGEKNK